MPRDPSYTGPALTPDGRKQWLVKELRRKRWLDARDTYVNIIIRRGRLRLGKEDLKMIGFLYRPDQEKPEFTFLRLLKEKEAWENLMQRLADVLTAMNLGPERQLSLLRDAVEAAEASGNTTQLLKAHDALERYLRLQETPGDPAANRDVLAAIVIESVEDANVLGYIERGDEAGDHAGGLEESDVVREDGSPEDGQASEPPVS